MKFYLLRRFKIAGVIILPCGLIFTSCSVSMSKKEQRENILQAPSLEKSIENAEKTSFFDSSRWPDKNWWEQYGFNELNQLINHALTSNPSIQAIYEKISLAKNEAIIARSKLFPLIYFDASDHWQYISKTGLYRALNPSFDLNSHLYDFGLSFSYEFDFWGKYRNFYKAAIGEYKASLAEAAQVELIVTTALAQAYFALRVNLLRKNLYSELYEVKKKYFELQKLMMQNSLYSKLTPLLSEEGVFHTEQLLYEIQQEIETNKHTVNILAGFGPDEKLLLDEPFVTLPPKLALPKDISIDLISRRPDLMAQIWKVEALAHRVGAAKAEFWPNISISALAGFSSTSLPKLFNMVSKTIGLLPAVKLPLYTAGSIGANVNARKAQFNEAVYQYNELILKSYQQVADHLALATAIYHEQDKQNEIISNSSLRYQLMTQRQQSGLDNALTAYQYLEDIIEKKINQAQLLYQQYLISVHLIKSLGGGYLFKEDQ